MKTLYKNGIFYTGDRECPSASAMVVEDGKIVWVGETSDWSGNAAEAAENEIDLEGSFVTPGFIDSHMHMLGYGQLLNSVSLYERTSSLADMCSAVGEFIEKHRLPAGSWVCGRGWNHDYFQDQKRFPDRHDLDHVSSEYPIMVTRACGHVAAVNSKALELAGVGRDTPQPEGGRFDVDESGEPVGIFRENGIDLIKRAIPAYTLNDVKQFLFQACRRLNGYGITSVHTDDFVSLPGVGAPMVMRAFRELEQEGRLTVKVYEQFHFDSLNQAKTFVERGWRTGAGSDRFRIGPMKIVADGSLGARTAYLSSPYEDEPSARGILIYSDEQLEEMMTFAHTHGIQLAVHAIGDGCLAQVVGIYEKILKKYPRDDHRHGVVHCQITTAALLKKFRELSLHGYIQTIFLDYDSRIIRARVGAERAAESYQFKTLLDLGCGVSNGSDCPVELPCVLNGIQCAVTRSSLDGSRQFLPEQALTVEEALATYTTMGARASFEEEKKGMLKAGMAADFVVLDRDIRTVRPETISQAAIRAVYVDGVNVLDLPAMCSREDEF